MFVDHVDLTGKRSEERDVELDQQHVTPTE
jgi:hypothetical protein